VRQVSERPEKCQVVDSHGAECDGQLKVDEAAVLRMDGLW
jgi:hypothetical protein